MHLIWRPKFCITLFWISLGTAVIPRINEQQRLCLFFWGGGGGGGEQIRCIMGQVQVANWIGHQHGRLVTWWQTKNSSIIDLGLRSLSHSIVWMLCSHSINPYTINPSTVFFYNQLGKIRRQHWTEHLNISKLAKFESDSERHIAPQSYENLQKFVC